MLYFPPFNLNFIKVSAQMLVCIVYRRYPSMLWKRWILHISIHGSIQRKFALVLFVSQGNYNLTVTSEKPNTICLLDTICLLEKNCQKEILRSDSRYNPQASYWSTSMTFIPVWTAWTAYFIQITKLSLM